MRHKLKIWIMGLMLWGCDNPQSAQPTPPPQTVEPSTTPDAVVIPLAEDTSTSNTQTLHPTPTTSAKKPDVTSPDDNDRPDPTIINAFQKQKFNPKLNQKLEEIDLKTICDFFDEQRAIAIEKIDISSWKEMKIPSKNMPIIFKAPSKSKIIKEKGIEEIPEIYALELTDLSNVLQFHLNKENWLTMDQFEIRGCSILTEENTWTVALIQVSNYPDVPTWIIHKIYRKINSYWVSAVYSIRFFPEMLAGSTYMENNFFDELHYRERILSTIQFHNKGKGD